MQNERDVPEEKSGWFGLTEVGTIFRSFEFPRAQALGVSSNYGLSGFACIGCASTGTGEIVPKLRIFGAFSAAQGISNAGRKMFGCATVHGV